MTNCNIDIIEVKVLEDYKLYLQFEDGSTGDVNISKIIPFDGVFRPLKEKDFFDRVFVNQEM